MSHSPSNAPGPSLSRDDIFLAAREMSDPAQRDAYVANACGEDNVLRAAVQTMLHAAAHADAFLGSDARGCSLSSPLRETTGTIIGRYQLLEKIGEGGMGVVYKAEQREPVVRKVALKVTKAGMDTSQVVARFEAERQALALMDHPNIAKVLDGGETESGRPYFVMDFVEGLPITQFCDETKLPTRERLDLFLEVCSAIQHAHQKGIIHRDIKPSNILVTLHGAKPVPKVIDFGIAKATQQPLTDKTLFTQFQHFIGTPAYMSPEQASVSGVDIDTRSDIYALGVLLYELLTGTTPFDGKELLKSGLDAMRRTIRDKEPLRPSTRLSSLGVEELTTAAKRRGVEAPALIHVLRGDLDWIVMKCLEKDRSRRYETANGLAADLQRHLGNKPIAARPPTVSYRARKFVQRYRLQVAVGVFALIVLLLAAAVSSWQAVRANRERARAERRLQATVQLMNEAFENVVPALSYTIGAAKPREDLAKVAVKIVKEMELTDEIRPEFRPVLAQLYLQAALIESYYFANTGGDYAEGLQFALKAIQLFQITLPDEKKEARVNHLAMAQMSAGFAAQGLLRFEDALAYFSSMRQTAGLLRASTNAYWLARGRTLDQWSRGVTAWALLQTDRPGEALTNHLMPLLEEATYRTPKRAPPSLEENWDLRDLHDSIGRAHLELDRPAEAIQHLRTALELAETNAQRHPLHAACATMLVESKARLGEALLASGQSEQALPLLDGALQRAEELRKLDPANPGFAQLKIQVRGSYAAAYMAWANLETDLFSERLQRLEKSGEMLKRANESVARIESESLRRFLSWHLGRIRKKSEEVKARLDLGKAGLAR